MFLLPWDFSFLPPHGTVGTIKTKQSPIVLGTTSSWGIIGLHVGIPVSIPTETSLLKGARHRHTWSSALFPEILLRTWVFDKMLASWRKKKYFIFKIHKVHQYWEQAQICISILRNLSCQLKLNKNRVPPKIFWKLADAHIFCSKSTFAWLSAGPRTLVVWWVMF